MKKSYHSSIQIKIHKFLNGDFLGAYKSRFNGSGLEFHNLRQYIHGDSVKRIDWKTTAKQNNVFIKNFEEERDIKIIFFLDLSINMQFGSKQTCKIDTLLEVFYTLSLSALHAGDSIGAYIINGKSHTFIECNKGEEVLYRIQEAIQYMRNIKNITSSPTIIEHHLKKLEKLKIHNSFLCILSDIGTLNIQYIKPLSLQNHILFCNIFDSFENILWNTEAIINLSQNHSFISTNLGNKTKQDLYIKEREDMHIKFKNSLQKNRIDYLLFDENTHVPLKFLQYFKSL